MLPYKKGERKWFSCSINRTSRIKHAGHFLVVTHYSTSPWGHCWGYQFRVSPTESQLFRHYTNIGTTYTFLPHLLDWSPWKHSKACTGQEISKTIYTHIHAFLTPSSQLVYSPSLSSSEHKLIFSYLWFNEIHENKILLSRIMLLIKMFME